MIPFAAASTGMVSINLDELWRHEFARAWEDIGELVAHGLPAEHEIDRFFYPGRGGIACMCFPCRAHAADKDARRAQREAWATAQRNGRCPCWSGRKFKKCCMGTR